MRPRGLAPILGALAVFASPSRANAEGGIRLDVEVDPAAGSCRREHVEAEIYAAQECQQGWDPGSSTAIHIHFAKLPKGYSGRIETPDGSDVLTGSTCAEVERNVGRAAAAWINGRPCHPTPATPATVSIAPASGREPGTLEFVVSLAPAQNEPVTVSYYTYDLTATADADYVGVAGSSLTFSPQEVARTIPITVLRDRDPEPDETFELVLLEARGNAQLATRNRAIGTILDDEWVPVDVRVENATLREGRFGPRILHVPVTLSRAIEHPVSVLFETHPESATAGSDFTAVSLSRLEFAPNETESAIAVTVHPDEEVEPDESFRVELSGPSRHARIVRGTAVGTIEDGSIGPAPPIPVFAGMEGGYGYRTGGTRGRDQLLSSLVWSGSVVAGGETRVGASEYHFGVMVTGFFSEKRDTKFPDTSNGENEFQYESASIEATAIRGAMRWDGSDAGVTIGIIGGGASLDGCDYDYATSEKKCRKGDRWLAAPTFAARMGPRNGPYATLGLLDGTFLAGEGAHIGGGVVLRQGRIDVGAVASVDGYGLRIDAELPWRSLGLVMMPGIAYGTIYDKYFGPTGRSTWLRAGLAVGRLRGRE